MVRFAQLSGIARVHANRDLLEIEQHVDDVFLHALDARVLVQHALNLGFGDRRTGHRGEQHATQGIAERGFGHTLERLDDHAGLTRRERADLHDAGLEEFGYGSLHVQILSRLPSITSSTTRRPGFR